jgi:starvation-inducible DNA-binding protein
MAELTDATYCRGSTTHLMFPTLINIPASERSQLADLLNQQLADLCDLGSQTKQAHWNVRGRHFYQHHKLFEELSAVVDRHIDELAERITTLGGYARGGVRDAARASRLDDFPTDQRDDQGYVDVMSARFASCANEVRLAVIAAEELDDATTADLLTAISRGLDKSLWMLEVHMRPLRGDVEIQDNERDSATEANAAQPSGPAKAKPAKPARKR